MGSIKFSVDSWMREKLESSVYSYSVEKDVSIAAIDLDDNEFQSRRNSHSFNKPLAADYAERMAAGDVFPEVVLVARVKPGKKATSYVVSCGRHRLVAAKMAGYTGISHAVVISAKSANDAEKAYSLSILDNVRNGDRVPLEVMYDQLADEAIRLNDGFSNGIPPHSVLRAVAARANLTHVGTLKKHIAAKMFRAKCVALRAEPPTDLGTCAAGYEFVNMDGFPHLLEVICREAECHGIAKILKDAGKSRVGCDEVIRQIVDAANGFTGRTRTKLGAAAQLRLRLADVVRIVGDGFEADESITAKECTETVAIVWSAAEKCQLILESHVRRMGG